MIIIGIDPSLTSTGICITDERGKVLLNQAIGSKLSGVKRLLDFKNQLMVFMNIYPLSKKMVFIESYSFGSVGKRESIAELGGTIRLTLFEQNIEFVDVPPTVLKKYVTGKGNADKIAMGVALQKQFGLEYPTSDQTDAFLLCELGRAYLGFIPGLAKFKEEVIADMKNPKAKKKKVAKV